MERCTQSRPRTYGGRPSSTVNPRRQASVTPGTAASYLARAPTLGRHRGSDNPKQDEERPAYAVAARPQRRMMCVLYGCGGLVVVFPSPVSAALAWLLRGPSSGCAVALSSWFSVRIFGSPPSWASALGEGPSFLYAFCRVGVLVIVVTAQAWVWRWGR
jgi:hypothetical protein